MQKSKLSNSSGITLVTLVVTIVILIILASISIGAIFGKNGLISRVNQAKEKHQIETAREKLLIKLTELQADAIENGKKLTLEDLIIINTTEKDMKVETTTTDEEGNEIEEKVVIYKEEGEKDYTKVTVDGYVFKVDEDFNIIYLDKRTDLEKDKDYEGAEDDDELEEGGIILDEDKENDPNADKIHSTVPTGWIGIYTEEDLINIKKDLSKKYIIMNDITLKQTWTPLGDSKTEFTGYLNGNGYTISNMKISGTNGYLGMFARTSGTAVITNLNIKNYTLTGKGKYIGGLVGYNKGNIRGVSFTGNLNINGEASYVGGLVGFHRYDSKTTTGIERVYTGGTLNAPQGTYVGGIVGLMQGYSSTYNHLTYIRNSYSTMATTGKTYVGGLVGAMRYSHLYNTYTIGKTVGTRTTGGVVANVNRACYANNTYWGKGITGQTKSALGMIKTMLQLGKQATYNNYDFAQVWGIDEDETTAYLQGMEVPEIIKEIIKGYNQQLGDGTKGNPYQIWTVEQLQNVKNDLAAYYIVMTDLDLGEITQWAPLGTKETPFTGNFNGNGYTIENMTIKMGSTANVGENIGLFGYVDGGTITNIILENYNISGGYGKCIGGLVGFSKGGIISKVYAEGNIVLSASTRSGNVGGIIGKVQNNGTCEQCYSGGSIVCSNAENFGGFVGYTIGSTFRNCYTSTDLSKINAYTGLGGFVGHINNGGTMEYCMALGKVSDGSNSRGGFQGGEYGGVGTVTSCYWSKELSGLLKGNCGIQKEVSSLVKQASYSGWNFSSIWSIEEGKSFAYLQGMKIPSIVFDSVAEYPFMEGKGTIAEPYIITNAEQLQKVQYDLSAYYILGNDIDLGSIKKWTPIGEDEYLKRFSGHFDGKGYTIKNMQIVDTSLESLGSVGLFGVIEDATIQNLILENYNIQGGKSVDTGALVGKGKGNITNVYTNGNINFASAGSATAMGGIIGRTTGQTNIQKCYTGGTVSGAAYHFGGIIGYATHTDISNCYSAMDITGNGSVGGIMGFGYSTNTIKYSYAIGKVTGKTANSTGGLIGSKGDSSTTGVVTSSYWCAELTGQYTSVVGINTTISNLSRQSGYSGWNFSTVWAIEEGTSFAYLQGMKIPDAVYDHLKDYSTLEGAGTSNNPYIITNAQQLDKIRYDLSKYYKLGNNIDLSSIAKWEPIGTVTNPFIGNFDGAGYTISNMKIQGNTSTDLGENIGLFGYVEGGNFSNVTLDNYSIKGGNGDNIGGLIGYIKGGNITKVAGKGSITLSGSTVSNYVGGLVGQVDSSNTVSVRITQCYTEGEITGTSTKYAGGLVGDTQGTSNYPVYITNSYSSMNININDYAGGLVGRVYAYNRVQYSYTIGRIAVTGTHGGGLAGTADANSSQTNSYWCAETTGQLTSGIGTNITVSNLVRQGSYSGWNFSTIWSIDEGGSFAYLQGMKKPAIVTEKVQGYSIIEGAGTSSNPYIITDAQQLTKIKYDLSAYYKLGQDIDLSSIAKWESIGTKTNPFTGNFNGDGHTISNMKISISGDMGDYIGLFGYIQSATISSLTLNNYSITGGYGDNIGALAGYSEGGKVSKIHVNGTISLSNTSTYSKYIGGIVGYASSLTTTSTTVTQCYSEGTISTSRGQNVGGLIGYAVGRSGYAMSASNSYSKMSISGYSNMGGLIGSAQAYATISNSYATGKITAGSKTSIGGLVGAKASTASASNSYWDTETTGQEASVLGTGYDTTTMQTARTYAGWSSTIWNIEEGSYPTLK